MSLSLLFACFWVVASTLVALLPMRLQYAPGLSLLLAAPVLLGWIAYDHGWWIFAAGFLAFVSMFRHPLRYLMKRAAGARPEVS
ncbi:MAG: DUF2484 family protein [Paracoccaceae bacterium]|nr:DUF2484 family protein [Paracoccaceae bacterium]